jgi:hypothetical protein
MSSARHHYPFLIPKHVRRYLCQPPSDESAKMIKIIRKCAPTIYADCKIYGFEGTHLGSIMLVAGGNYAEFNLWDSYPSTERMERADLYYKCQ